MTKTQKKIVRYILTTFEPGRNFWRHSLEGCFGRSEEALKFIESIEGTLIERAQMEDYVSRHQLRVTDDPMIIARFRLEIRQ